jgi:hypothetical protein
MVRLATKNEIEEKLTPGLAQIGGRLQASERANVSREVASSALDFRPVFMRFRGDSGSSWPVLRRLRGTLQREDFSTPRPMGSRRNDSLARRRAAVNRLLAIFDPPPSLKNSSSMNRFAACPLLTGVKNAKPQFVSDPPWWRIRNNWRLNT